MTLDRFPDELEEFVERVNVALHGEITSAKSIVARANAEKASIANALADLQRQIAEVQADLDRSPGWIARSRKLAESWRSSRLRQQKRQKLSQRCRRSEPNAKPKSPRSITKLASWARCGPTTRKSSPRSGLSF